ncbi:ARI7 [Symbiodinium natans]|uniref:RBR-type E3 ubiquitin transferase n=1 Tax=Symbiodinium natans TaxID=878477 RepID=A0A812MRD9_9DINO|nr:ARI7 [Symbiodinium natans]
MGNRRSCFTKPAAAKAGPGPDADVASEGQLVLVRVEQVSGNQLLCERFRSDAPVREIFDRVISTGGLGNLHLLSGTEKLELSETLGGRGFGAEVALTAVAIPNLAFRKPCEMSSNYTHPGSEPRPRERDAVDGDNEDRTGNCAHTGADSEAWWQVDLGNAFEIGEIHVYTRKVAMERLWPCYVLVSERPFPPGNGTLEIARRRASAERFCPKPQGEGAEQRRMILPFSCKGRYVRVQLARRQCLQLTQAGLEQNHVILQHLAITEKDAAAEAGTQEAGLTESSGHLVLWSSGPSVLWSRGFPEQQRLVSEAVECTGVEEDDALLLLRACRWDVAVYNEAFFEDAEALRARHGISEGEEELGPTSELCGICFCAPGEQLLPCSRRAKPEEKPHPVFCLDCWRQYAQMSVEEGKGCLDLHCPAPGCKELLRPRHFSQLLEASSMRRFRRFLTESLVDDSQGRVKWCPGAGCQRAASDPGTGEVQCPCGLVWCFACGNDVHKPVQCETVKLWEAKNRNEGSDVLWIKVNTKLCPKCNNSIEKNGGCMHMTCRKPGGCGHEFCWICMKPWKDHTQCNAISEDQLETQKKAAAKSDLLRYAHFFDRYLAHHKAEQFAATGQAKALEAVAELYLHQLQVEVNDVAFLKRACEQVRNSRRFLKWTYAYGFFATYAGDQRKLFEFHQAQLEGTLERLSDILENTHWESYLLTEVLSCQPFYDLRARVINLTGVVHDFFGKLQEAMQQDTLLQLTGSPAPASKRKLPV